MNSLHQILKWHVFDKRFFWRTFMVYEFTPTRYWKNWITGETHTIKQPHDLEGSWKIVLNRIDNKRRITK